MTKQEASENIALILNRYERDNGVVVRGIDIQNTDTTRFEDSNPQMIRAVLIDDYPIPGSIWCCAEPNKETK